jgi:hypothetical protein
MGPTIYVINYIDVRAIAGGMKYFSHTYYHRTEKPKDRGPCFHDQNYFVEEGNPL